MERAGISYICCPKGVKRTNPVQRQHSLYIKNFRIIQDIMFWWISESWPYINGCTVYDDIPPGFYNSNLFAACIQFNQAIWVLPRFFFPFINFISPYSVHGPGRWCGDVVVVTRVSCEWYNYPGPHTGPGRISFTSGVRHPWADHNY